MAEILTEYASMEPVETGSGATTPIDGGVASLAAHTGLPVGRVAELLAAGEWRCLLLVLHQ
jgi:hypothetical protein